MRVFTVRQNFLEKRSYILRNLPFGVTDWQPKQIINHGRITVRSSFDECQLKRVKGCHRLKEG
jgi:hypothetical protein